MKDGRGVHMIDLRDKNRNRIRAWAKDNPNGTLTDCGKDLKLSYNCITGHLQAISEEKRVD